MHSRMSMKMQLNRSYSKLTIKVLLQLKEQIGMHLGRSPIGESSKGILQTTPGGRIASSNSQIVNTVLLTILL
jgi:hypothetical protein